MTASVTFSKWGRTAGRIFFFSIVAMHWQGPRRFAPSSLATAGRCASVAAGDSLYVGVFVVYIKDDYRG